jgi:hypothetical protein
MYDVWWCGSYICYLENKVTMCTIYYVYSKPVVVVYFYRTVNLWCIIFGHKGIVNTHFFFNFFNFFDFFDFLQHHLPSLKECIYMYDVWWCGGVVRAYATSMPHKALSIFDTLYSVTKESSILIFFSIFSIFSIFFNTTFFERMYMYVWCVVVWWCGAAV